MSQYKDPVINQVVTMDHCGHMITPAPAHLLLLSWRPQLQCYIPTIRDVNTTTTTSTLNMFVKTGYLQSVRQEEIVLWMSCRYLCLCRHVYSEQISLT